MKYLIIFFLFFLQVNFSVAQKKPPGELTDGFAFEVKTIDDFMERFNFEQNTDFMKYLQANYPKEIITRERLLYSLFNSLNKNLAASAEKISFVNEMTDTTLTTAIHFTDPGWYVELECKVSCSTCKIKTQRLYLILKVEEKKAVTKWSIVSARGKFLGNSTVPAEDHRLQDSTRFFLHPMSHALDFMNIDEPFKKKNYFQDYVYNGPHTPQLDTLISKVRKSEIKFIQVNTISYHFLQLKGWVLRVDFFNRSEKNSGWLINELFRATPEEASYYLSHRLNVPPVK